MKRMVLITVDTAMAEYDGSAFFTFGAICSWLMVGLLFLEQKVTLI
ncbi:MAG: hypothetical protein RJR35_04005 [Thermoanaerobacterales bacterium]|nr:hypothetical protein [Thermoanaerobacterales bacterium]